MASIIARIRAFFTGMSFCVFLPLISALSLMLPTMLGTFAMLIGNAILRMCQFEGNNFTNDLSAARIGALGGFAMAIPTTIVGGMLSPVLPLITFGFQVASTVVGCAILQKMHVDIGHIDLRYAAIAGSVGVAVLDIGLLIVFGFLSCLGIIIFGIVAVSSQDSPV